MIVFVVMVALVFTAAMVAFHYEAKRLRRRAAWTAAISAMGERMLEMAIMFKQVGMSAQDTGAAMQRFGQVLK